MRCGLFGSDKLSLVLQSISVFWKRKRWQDTHLGLENRRASRPPAPLGTRMLRLVTWRHVHTH